MSLINEALRKARKEAAEREAAEKGTTYREPRAHLPSRTSWLPALVAGVALGLLVAAGSYFLLSASEPGTTEPEAGASPSPPNATATTPQLVPNPTVTPADSVPNPTVTPETSLKTEAEPGPPSETERPNPTATPEAIPNPTVTFADPTPADPAISAPKAETAEIRAPNPAPNPTATPEAATPEVRRVQPPEQVGEVGDRVYVLEAEVDGVSLRLDFIVWSSSNPFAQINGSQVSVGQTVEGFLVRSIAREEVTLEGAGGAFRLRVR